jgi:hypothetical protein
VTENPTTANRFALLETQYSRQFTSGVTTQSEPSCCFLPSRVFARLRYDAYLVTSSLRCFNILEALDTIATTTVSYRFAILF